jgi:hypothetical protein
MIDINYETIVVRGSEIIASEVDGEVILMSLAHEKYYGLDDIGSLIWRIISKPVSVKEIIELLRKEYAVDEESCYNEVKSFLIDLHSKGAISVDEGYAA